MVLDIIGGTVVVAILVVFLGSLLYGGHVRRSIEKGSEKYVDKIGTDIIIGEKTYNVNVWKAKKEAIKKVNNFSDTISANFLVVYKIIIRDPKTLKGSSFRISLGRFDNSRSPLDNEELLALEVFNGLKENDKTSLLAFLNETQLCKDVDDQVSSELAKWF